VRDWEAFAEDVAAHVPLWRARGLAHTQRPQIGA
jgi:hypothetical protein